MGQREDHPDAGLSAARQRGGPVLAAVGGLPCLAHRAEPGGGRMTTPPGTTPTTSRCSTGTCARRSPRCVGRPHSGRSPRQRAGRSAGAARGTDPHSSARRDRPPPAQPSRGPRPPTRPPAPPTTARTREASVGSSRPSMPGPAHPPDGDSCPRADLGGPPRCHGLTLSCQTSPNSVPASVPFWWRRKRRERDFAGAGEPDASPAPGCAQGREEVGSAESPSPWGRGVLVVRHLRGRPPLSTETAARW